MNPVIATILNGVRADIAAKEAKRKVKELEMQEKIRTAAAFGGHVCDLPQKERTYEGMYWRCNQCRQYWHIRVIKNIHRWQTFGIDAFKTLV